MSRGQLKPISTKSKIPSSDEPEIWTSPKFSRKNDPQASIKITKNEVEEKLKYMKLKRLSRLGTSLTEQSPHFDEDRVLGSKPEAGEDRAKPTFKKIAEEILKSQAEQELKIVPEKAPVITTENNKDVNRTKPSSTKKFINKFNCVMNTDEVSSVENIEKSQDSYSKPSDATPKNQFTKEPGYVGKTQQSVTPSKNSFHRKTIYFKENEPVPPDLILTASPPITRGQIESSSQQKEIQIKSDAKLVEDIEEQESHLGFNNTGIQVISNEDSDIIPRQNLEISTNIQRNSSGYLKPPSSPVLSASSVTREDKVLKKLQHSCKSLDEILKYDSDVDLDEMDDMRTTLDEAASLLTEYKNKLKTLEEKVTPIVYAKQKLCAVKSHLKKVKDDVGKFNGLKRDLQYMQLCNRLSNFYLEINNIFKKFELGNEKNELLADVEKCIKDLEVKVAKNEEILYKILSDQVEHIGRKYLTVTNI